MGEEIDKRRFENAVMSARRAGRVRREEQDRIGDQIEQLLHEAKGQEAVDMLVSLARHVFDPPRK